MFPDDTSIAVVFVSKDPMQPVASFRSFVSLLRVLLGSGIGILPHWSPTETDGRQQGTAYFLDKTTADNLIFLDPNVTAPDHGLELLVKQFRQQEKPGAMTGLAFRWPRGDPNILMKAGTERLGGYSFPTYVPMMDIVGQWSAQHRQYPRGNPVLLPPKVIDVPYFSGGLFVVSREVLEKMDGLYFHDRQGYYMGAFCNKVRALGHSVKAAMNIICSGGGVNHINFLENYGVKSWDNDTTSHVQPEMDKSPQPESPATSSDS